LANAEWEPLPAEGAQDILGENEALPLNLNLNEFPEGEDVVMNGGEIVDPVGGEAAGEIILDEAFIEANDQPVIIEEVAEPVEEEPALPLNDFLWDNLCQKFPQSSWVCRLPFNSQAIFW